jgi:hypothetical protein
MEASDSWDTRRERRTRKAAKNTAIGTKHEASPDLDAATEAE